MNDARYAHRRRQSNCVLDFFSIGDFMNVFLTCDEDEINGEHGADDEQAASEGLTRMMVG